MKKIITLLLALVMCVGLAVPALAAPVPALPDADAIETANADAPQYSVFYKYFWLYIGTGTYADMVFSISDKGGKNCFESLDHVSFNAVDFSGFYWQITSCSYQLSDSVCDLTVLRKEMYGDTPTGYSELSTYSIPIEEVMDSSRNGDPVILSPELVSVSHEVVGAKLTIGGMEFIY